MPQTAEALADSSPQKPPAGKTPVHKRRGLLGVLSSALLALVVLLVLVGVGGVVGGVWRFDTIDTGSMRPVLNPGDIAVLVSEPVAHLQVGQIVAFHPPDDPTVTVIHRVMSIDRSNDAVVIETKGDANNANDSWHAHVLGKVVWYERARVAAVGYVTTWAQQPVVRFAALVIIVVLAVSLWMGRIWRRSPPRYHPAGYSSASDTTRSP